MKIEIDAAYLADGDVQTRPARRASAARDTLLSAASALMHDGDTLDITLNEIAQKAGVNSALVGYHFGSKRGLLIALIERDALVALDHFSHLLEMPLTATQKLRYHLEGVINTYERYPYLNRLLGIVIRDSEADEAIVISERFIRPIINAYERLILEGVEQGEFRPISAMNLYFICIGMCEEIFASGPILRNCFGVERLDETLKKSFVKDVCNIITAGLGHIPVEA